MGMMGIFFSSPFSATLTSLLTHPPPSPMKKKRLNNKTWLDLNIYIYIYKNIPLSPLDGNLSLIPFRKSHFHGLCEQRNVVENQHHLSQHAVLKMSLFQCLCVFFSPKMKGFAVSF